MCLVLSFVTVLSLEIVLWFKASCSLCEPMQGKRTTKLTLLIIFVIVLVLKLQLLLYSLANKCVNLQMSDS